MKKYILKRCTAMLCSAALVTGFAGNMPVFAESENLITNSTFDSDTKGWSYYAHKDDLTGDESYIIGAEKQLHYLLGRNMCYVTGHGTASPKHPHHRPSIAKGKPMTGMLAGGVNPDLADPAAQKYLKDSPADKCYIEDEGSYSTNEITIYRNSPLIYQLSLTEKAAAENDAIPEGWLLWHNYSDYFALDSRLYLRTPDGITKEITGDFIHAMNGSFGTSPDQITFMAIDSKADEWDIYIVENGKTVNLTQNSGFRNEDPKWSPDGKSIVFKRGRWDNGINDFVYNLALLDVKTREITMLTDDIAEEAMPYFSADGKIIYYVGYKDGIGSIYGLDIDTGKITAVYSESGVNAYYPIVSGNDLYFAKWYSKDNHCDQIVRWDGKNLYELPFNSEKFDCSDICPVDGDRLIFSSMMNGNYDLFCYDGNEIAALSELNTDINELGADFFPCNLRGDVNADGSFNIADAVMLQKWLVGAGDIINWKAGDLLADNQLDVFDLCVMKKEITALFL